MKKGLTFLLVLVIVILLILVFMLWQRKPDSGKSAQAPVNNEKNKATKLPLKAKGKNMMFSIKNKKELIIRERVDSLHPYIILDSFSLSSGVALGFTKNRDSMVIKDPDIPDNYYIIGVDVNLLNAVPPTINSGGNEVSFATSAGYDLSGMGTPIVNDDPGDLNKLFFRVRGMASGCGVGFASPEPSATYFNFDFEMSQAPGPGTDLYLQLDPNPNYNHLLLVGFPSKSNLVMSLNPIPAP